LKLKLLLFERSGYGFVNKRLPVVKLAYDTPENTTYFIKQPPQDYAKVENAIKEKVILCNST
jgi:hypothetical protein